MGAIAGIYLLQSQSIPVEEIVDSSTGQPVRTSDVPENGFVNFVYPRANGMDSDTFRQFVLIHLRKGFTAPKNMGIVDRISGDTFIALSRVCVHLWCLCNFDSSDELLVCPCHSSEFVAGTGPPYDEAPGTAISGPAAQQAAPNNTLPIAALSIAADGTLSVTGIIGQVGCGQQCEAPEAIPTVSDGSN